MKTFVLCCICLIFLGGLGGKVAGETIKAREIVVYSPKSLGKQPAPLVIALHGGLGNARQFQFSLGLNRFADKYGFRVMYPHGTETKSLWTPNGRVWNAGTCCGPAMRIDVNDVAHIKAIVSDTRRQGLVTQVIGVGHSNGAMMALRVACDAPNVFDKVVAIAGPVLITRCNRQSNLQVVHIHGTVDKTVPIGGSVDVDPASQLNFPSLQSSVDLMSEAGADVSVLTVSSGHYLAGINRALRSKRGISLAEFVAKQVVQ